MDSSSNSSNIESEIKKFERYVGKLTEKYPFDYENCYSLNNDPYCHYSKCLTLKPDHTFTAFYLISFGEGHTSVCEYEALGQYSYNPETRILTLNRNTQIPHSFLMVVSN